MRITHVSIYPPKGEKHSTDSGVASYTKNLTQSIPYKNDEVSIICNKSGARDIGYKENGIQVWRVFHRQPFFLFKILKQLKKTDPELIHIQQELGLYGNILTAFILPILVFCLRKKKTIITLHGVVSLKKIDKTFITGNNSKSPVWLVKLAFMLIYRPLCHWTDKILVHEEIFKNILVTEYGVKPGKIHVIHHGVENYAALAKETACCKLRLDPLRDIVLFMGYQTGYKGLDLLIEGFAKYAKRNANAFLVIGAGLHPKFKNDKQYLEEYSRLKKKTQNLIPAGQFIWPGFIHERDINLYFSASDISIYPYTIAMSSSGPMSIAIGHGKPFLASDIFSGSIKTQELLFERNPEKLSDKLVDFFSNKYGYEKISKQMKVSRLWKEIGKKTYNLYLLIA